MTDLSATDNRETASRRPFWIYAVAGLLILGAFAALLSLGFWQLQRLEWKNALIERIETRMAAEPIGVEAALQLVSSGEGIEYRPVQVTGTFDHEGTSYFFSTFNSQSGWDVITPLSLAEPAALRGDVVLVNRGFVPYDQRDPATRSESEPSGTVTIDGLAREPIDGKPTLAPSNKPDEGTFFWKDYSAMAEHAGYSARQTLPFAIDAGRPGQRHERGVLPMAGTTYVDLPNSHLSYAFTWFGLAATLLIVCAAFLLRGRFLADGEGH